LIVLGRQRGFVSEWLTPPMGFFRFLVSLTTCVWSTVSLTKQKRNDSINLESSFNNGCVYFGL
jgi:hypothetical protein